MRSLHASSLHRRPLFIELSSRRPCTPSPPQLSSRPHFAALATVGASRNHCGHHSQHPTAAAAAIATPAQPPPSQPPLPSPHCNLRRLRSRRTLRSHRHHNDSQALVTTTLKTAITFAAAAPVPTPVVATSPHRHAHTDTLRSFILHRLIQRLLIHFGVVARSFLITSFYPTPTPAPTACVHIRKGFNWICLCADTCVYLRVPTICAQTCL